MPADTVPSSPDTPFFVAGGTLHRDALCYVTRDADNRLFEAIGRGEFCYVLTSRQMGKSSLMVRTTLRLREAGFAVAVLDLTAVGQNLSPEQWYNGLLSLIGQQLHLEDALEDFWEAHASLPPLMRFLRAIHDVVLPSLPGKLVLFVDEVDAVRSLRFSADEFFAGIREVYNARTQDPTWNRLAVGLFGVASPSDLIQDVRTTPFNIGTRIELRDFTEAEAAVLAEGLDHTGQGQEFLRRIFYWTNGHPYLTLRLCRALAEKSVPQGLMPDAWVDKQVEALFLSHRARETDDNLLFVRRWLLESHPDRAAVLDLYQKVCEFRRIFDEETNPLVTVLRLAGITGVLQTRLIIRNPIYEKVFDRDWIKANMPDAERRRQKEAFQKGLSFALLALHQKKQAEQQTEQAERMVYIANMNLVQREWEANNIERVKALLKETETSRFRGFEWGYWNRLCHLDLLTRENQSGVPIALFPQGKTFKAHQFGNAIEVLDFRTDEKRQPLEVLYSSPNIVIALSPDGRRIVTSEREKTLRFWDTRTGKEQISFKHLDRDGWRIIVICLAFSPSGKSIVAGTQAGTVWVWNVATGEEICTLGPHDYPVHSVAFSPDEKYIATRDEKGVVKVWNVQTRQSHSMIRGSGGYAFSHDSQYFVTGTSDGTVKVWDVHTGQERLTFSGHQGAITSAVFSHDGRRIITGGNDATLRVWETQTGTLLSTLKGHEAAIQSLLLSPNGRRIITGSWDRTVKVWQAEKGLETLTLRQKTKKITVACFHPDGRHIVTGDSTGSVWFWSAETGTPLFSIKAHRYYKVNSLVCSPDGKLIATRTQDAEKKEIKIQEIQTKQTICTIRGYSSYDFLTFSPDSKHIACCMDRVKIFAVETGQEVLAFHEPTDYISHIAFSPDGLHLAVVDGAGTVHIWNVKTGRKHIVLKSRKMGSLAFSSDGKRIVTGSLQGNTRIWNTMTGDLIHTLKGFTFGTWCVAFSPDDTRIVTGDSDGTVRLWESTTGREILTLNTKSAEFGFGFRDEVRKILTPRLSSVAFSPDGKRLLTVNEDWYASDDNTVKIWYATPPEEKVPTN